MPTASLMGALNIGISGLFVNRLATNVLNHNIANANTPGYSRQSMEFGSGIPLSTPYGFLGVGVRSGGVTRAGDRFLERQFHDQSAMLGTYVAMDENLASIESVLGSTENNRIGDAMTSFFEAYADLATPPSDGGKKQGVVSAARTLAHQFREIDAGLAQLEREAQESLEDRVNSVNSILHQVADLNHRILEAKRGENLPNDLLDQRGRLLSELSTMSRFTLHERSDGTVDVILEGRSVVTRRVVNEIRLEEGHDADNARVVVGGGNGEPVRFEVGELAGTASAVYESLPSVRAALDELAVMIMERVNGLHRQGVGPAGSGFDLFDGTSAGTMAVNVALSEDPLLVATGRSGEAGDNELALEIAALAATAPQEGGISINDHHARMIVDLATERGSYQTLRESQAGIVQSVYTRLEGARGVNLDEELVDLMRFQRAFEANARVISSVDEMLDTLINRMI